MLDPNLLKTLHIAGALGVFSAMGAIVLGEQESQRKVASMLHGVSLLLLFLAGFAILGKPLMHVHYWKVKIVLWLFLGVAPVLARKKVLPAPALLVVTLLVGILAAYLGVKKPF